MFYNEIHSTKSKDGLDEKVKSSQVEIKELKRAKESYVDKVEALLLEKSELSRVNGELNERVVGYQKEIAALVLKSDELKEQLAETRLSASELNSLIVVEQQQRKLAEQQLADHKVELKMSKQDNKLV